MISHDMTWWRQDEHDVLNLIMILKKKNKIVSDELIDTQHQQHQHL
jgi:hypothetical protein